MAEAGTISFPRRAAQAILVTMMAMMLGYVLIPQLSSIAGAGAAEPISGEIIVELNAERAVRGLILLAPLRSLSQSAGQSLDGLVDWAELAETGVAEAFSHGTTVTTAVDQALNTPHRRALLLSEDITHVGVDAGLVRDRVTQALEIHMIFHVSAALDDIA